MEKTPPITEVKSKDIRLLTALIIVLALLIIVAAWKFGSRNSESELMVATTTVRTPLSPEELGQNLRAFEFATTSGPIGLELQKYQETGVESPVLEEYRLGALDKLREAAPPAPILGVGEMEQMWSYLHNQ